MKGSQSIKNKMTVLDNVYEEHHIHPIFFVKKKNTEKEGHNLNGSTMQVIFDDKRLKNMNSSQASIKRNIKPKFLNSSYIDEISPHDKKACREKGAQATLNAIKSTGFLRKNSSLSMKGDMPFGRKEPSFFDKIGLTAQKKKPIDQFEEAEHKDRNIWKKVMDNYEKSGQVRLPNFGFERTPYYKKYILKPIINKVKNNMKYSMVDKHDSSVYNSLEPNGLFIKSPRSRRSIRKPSVITVKTMLKSKSSGLKLSQNDKSKSRGSIKATSTSKFSQNGLKLKISPPASPMDQPDQPDQPDKHDSHKRTVSLETNIFAMTNTLNVPGRHKRKVSFSNNNNQHNTLDNIHTRLNNEKNAQKAKGIKDIFSKLAKKLAFFATRIFFFRCIFRKITSF